MSTIRIGRHDGPNLFTRGHSLSNTQSRSRLDVVVCGSPRVSLRPVRNGDKIFPTLRIYLDHLNLPIPDRIDRLVSRRREVQSEVERRVELATTITILVLPMLAKIGFDPALVGKTGKWPLQTARYPSVGKLTHPKQHNSRPENCSCLHPCLLYGTLALLPTLPREIQRAHLFASPPFCVYVIRENCGNLPVRSEEHTSELQSQFHLVCSL